MLSSFRCLAIVVFNLVFTAISAQALDDNLRNSLSGSWQWEQAKGICQKESLTTISFSADGNAMYLSSDASNYRDPDEISVHTYDIVGQPEVNLRTVIQGETRRTHAGDVVMWDIKMISNNEFCWHRSDWRNNECTQSLIKC